MVNFLVLLEPVGFNPLFKSAFYTAASMMQCQFQWTAKGRVMDSSLSVLP